MWKESFILTLKICKGALGLHGVIVYDVKEIIDIFKNANFLPGALLGVVGGAGVLKGSKFTGSDFRDCSFFVGRGDAGAREVLLDWLKF